MNGRENMRKAGIAAVLLAAFIVAFISGCTKTQVMDLDISTVKEVNDTKVVANESRYVPKEEGHGLIAVPAEAQEWLCSEKVLLAMRSCKWNKVNPGNLDIAVKNNGYLNMTMAFYFYNGNGEKIADAYNDTNFQAKDELVFTIPFAEFEEKYGKIDNIHLAPVLVEGDNMLSCTNKVLPILVEGCG